MTTTAPKRRVVPLPDELTERYWRAAANHEFVIQRCMDCGNYQHPPRVYCLACHEGELEFEQVSGRGTVYSYSAILESDTPGLEAPYTVIIAELAEQPELWILSTCPPDVAVHVGDELELSFEDISPDFSLPQLLPLGVAARGGTNVSGVVDVANDVAERIGT